MAKQLMTSGQITAALEGVLGYEVVNFNRVSWILRTRRHIEPVMRAGGTIALYDPGAVQLVLVEIQGILRAKTVAKARRKERTRGRA